MIELYQLPSIRTDPQIISARLDDAVIVQKKEQLQISAMRTRIIEVLADGVPRTKYQIADLVTEYPHQSICNAVNKMGMLEILRSAGYSGIGKYRKKLYAKGHGVLF